MDITFLLELAMAMMLSFVFIYLGFETAETWWKGTIYFMISTLTSFESILLLIASEEPFARAFQFIFLLFGIISFVMVIILPIQAWNIRPNNRNRRYQPEKE